MKQISSISAQTFAVGLCLLAAVGSQPAHAQPVTNYWDINGSTPGSGGPTPSGNWEDPSWSLDPTGSSATSTWTEGNVPVFAAGSDATGAYVISANSNHTVLGVQAPTGAVTINGPGVLTIPSGSQTFSGTNLTINAILNGAGGFQSGTSDVISLYGNNGYAGGTSLGGGSIHINNNSGLGTGGITPIFGGASPAFSALFLDGLSPITLTNSYSITTSNAGVNFVTTANTPLTNTGNVDLQQTFYCRNAGPSNGIVTFSGVLSDSGGLVLSGNSAGNDSIIVLSGANTYTGQTVVGQNGGGGTRITLNFSSIQPLGSSTPNNMGLPSNSAAGQIDVGNSGFACGLRYTGTGDTTDRTINNINSPTGGMWLYADGTGPITYSGNITAAPGATNSRTITLQGSSTALNTISGAIQDSTGGTSNTVNVIKESPSTWALTGTNTFTGFLTVQNTTGLGGTSTLVLGGSNVYAGNTTISANSVLQLAGPNPVPHGPGHGNFTIASTGKFELAGFNCSIDGGGGAGTIDNNTGNATLTIDNNGVNQGPIFTGPIQDSGTGVLNLTVNCGGTCQITNGGGNAYHGFTVVSNAVLEYTQDNQLGVAPASLVTNWISIDSGLGWNGTSNSGNYYLRLQGTTTISLNANRGIYLGNTAGYGGGIGAQSSATLNVNGPISGPGALFSGGGTPHAATGIVVLFNTNNSWSGGTFVVGGTLRLGANNVLPFGTPVVISDTQAVTFGMNTHNQTIGTLTGNNFAQVGLNSGALTIRETAPTTFAGVINQNNGSLILDSSSTSALTLTGTNTYTGTTVINGGTLALSANGSIASTASITIGNKGTFSVSGLNTALTLSTNQLNIGGTGGFSATLATAASKGLTMGATNALNFTAYDGSTVPLTISGAGTMTLAAGNPVTVTVSGSPLGGGSYKLISKGASGSVAGAVPTSLTVNGAGAVAGTNSLSITGGELFLNVVPNLSPVTHVGIAPAGGGNLSINYSGGAGSKFVLLQSSNAATALTNWTRLQTNTTTPGSFNITPGAAPVEFFSIQSQ